MRLGLILLSLQVHAVLVAQPGINALVNGASNGTGVAPGSFATIYGTGLASGTATASDASLGTSLGGVTVTVNGRQAPLYFVRQDQINFQVPFGTVIGSASAIVQTGGQFSAPFAFEVLPAAPGILVFGDNRAVAQNQDGSLNTADNPALPGTALVAYLTGQGALDNSLDDGAPAAADPLSRAAQPSSASIGGQNAPIAFLGLTPGFVGLLQANLTVPALAPGDYPLVVSIGGRSSNAPVVSVGSAASGLLSRLGATDTGGGNVNVQVDGGFAYVCSNGGVAVVDVANPADPRFLNLFGGTTGFCRIRDGQLASASGTQSPVLNVFSLSNPEQPSRIGGPFSLPQFGAEFNFVNSYAVFTTVWFSFSSNPNRIFRQQGDLFSVNLTDPTRPTLGNTLRPDGANPASTNESPYFSAIHPAPDTLLLLSTTNTGADTSSGLGRMVVADVSDPSNLRAVRQVSVPRTNTLNCGALEGTTALVVGNTTSWQSPGDFAIRGNVTLTTFDLSDPRNPRAVATSVTNVRNTFTAPACVALGGGWFAYASFLTPENASDTAIVVVDARDPGNPGIASTLALPDLVERGLSVSGDVLYAVTRTGLTTYRIRR
ncbi:MAG: hypothetical protein IPM24_14265 [Bryobacterales bacterium]|nr:hypothetical protein [Bryobacterales bacterium]